MTIIVDPAHLKEQASTASALSAHLDDRDYARFVGLLEFLDELLAIAEPQVLVVFAEAGS